MEDKKIPLAYRMCPKTIDEYVGQEHILAKDKMLYRLIKADRLSSIILYGPPGCGKTSLARVIANSTKNKFAKLNAGTIYLFFNASLNILTCNIISPYQ